jgi:hypothetical protein
MPKTVLAVAAHPDNIELMMAGTPAMPGRAGYGSHYLWSLRRGNPATTWYLVRVTR